MTPEDYQRSLIRVDQKRLERTQNDLVRKAEKLERLRADIIRMSEEVQQINEQAEASIAEARRQVALVRDVTCLRIAYAGGWVALAGALVALGL